MCSGKAFSKLMRKHKGLLRVDLRSNAVGLSGVLQMMPKSGVHSALEPPQGSQLMTSTALAPSGNAEHALQQGHNSMVSQTGFGEAAVEGQQHMTPREISSSRIQMERREVSAGAKVSVTSRKGLVPKFTADSHHVSQQLDKENNDADNAQGPEKKSKAAAQRVSARPVIAKSAGRVEARAKHVMKPSTACPAHDEFEFETVTGLQSQPTAALEQFAEPDLQLADQPDTASVSGYYAVDNTQLSARLLDSVAVGSASFEDWAQPADDEQQLAQPSAPVIDHSFASRQLEMPGTARTARKSVLFQDRLLNDEHKTTLQLIQQLTWQLMLHTCMT